MIVFLKTYFIYYTCCIGHCYPKTVVVAGWSVYYKLQVAHFVNRTGLSLH